MSLPSDATVKCPNCNSELPDDSIFCQVCGIKLPFTVTPEISQFDVLMNELLTNIDTEELTGNTLLLRPSSHYPPRNHTQAEIQQKLQYVQDIAIQKRFAKTKVYSKKRLLAAGITTAIIALLLVIIVMGGIHNRELRNFATTEMRTAYSNVYADIISMKPEYFVYSKSVSPYSNITKVICKCQTIDGETIWATFDIWDYPDGNAHIQTANKPHYYSKSTPMRLTGCVTTAERIDNNLATFFGDVFILDVESMQSQ